MRTTAASTMTQQAQQQCWKDNITNWQYGNSNNETTWAEQGQ
jgi:hypothetical protein